MKLFVKAAALAAVFLAGACQVSVDNQSKVNAENAADSAGAAIERAGKGAAAVAERAGNAVERSADRLGNGVDVHVNLSGDDDAGKRKKR